MSKFCTNCGAPLEEGATFCSSCGTSVGTNNSETNYTTNTQNTSYQNTQTTVYPQQTVVGEQKSKIAAGILGILLGGFGIHNFYLGYTSKAVAQLLITVLSCFVLSPISSIWGLVEGIMILTGSIKVDAKGIPLKD